MPSYLDALVSGGTKSEIVRVLASEWPLNARQIFHKIKGVQGKEITYQGVHKAVKQLETAGVVRNAEKGYALSSEWLAQAKKFVDAADAKYSGKSLLTFDDIAEGSSAALSFDSYWSALMWVLYEMKRVYEERGKGDTVAVHWNHPWPLTALSKDDFEKLKIVMGIGMHYAVCPSNNPMDQLLLDFWRRLGKREQHVPGLERDSEEITVYEYLVQIYPCKKVRDKLDAFFESGETFDAKKLEELYKIIYNKDSKTDLIIVRNKEIADNARKSVLAHFK
ncbi:MAG: hypothetical protein WC792_04925 [Candidatus Micrarchaeia archaeon]|jgi:hypothetical protein